MQKIKFKILFFLSIGIISFSTPIFARYYEKIENVSAYATIAEPIIKVEALQDVIIKEVTENMQVEDYYFCVKNYDQNDVNKRINEIDFSYSIEIKMSNEKFPVKFKLYDIETGEELLKGNNKILRFRNFEKYRI